MRPRWPGPGCAASGWQKETPRGRQDVRFSPQVECHPDRTAPAATGSGRCGDRGLPDPGPRRRPGRHRRGLSEPRHHLYPQPAVRMQRPAKRHLRPASNRVSARDPLLWRRGGRLPRRLPMLQGLPLPIGHVQATVVSEVSPLPGATGRDTEQSGRGVRARTGCRSAERHGAPMDPGAPQMRIECPVQARGRQVFPVRGGAGRLWDHTGHSTRCAAEAVS